MPDPATARSFGWRRFWFTIKQEVETYHHHNHKSRIFQPGEIAHAKGVVLQSYWDFLVRNGYELTEDERWVIRHAVGPNNTKLAKPVVVLKRLGHGKYIVCRCSSWGGKIQPADILSRVQRYFAFSASQNLGEWPPGAKILRCSPPLRATSAVIMIPVESQYVDPVDWKTRAFLCVGQLERLEAMIKKREKDFPLVAEELRQTEAEIQKSKRTSMHLWTSEMRDMFKKCQEKTNLIVHNDPGYRKHSDYVRVRPISLSRNPKEELMRYRDTNAPRLLVQKSVNLINWAFNRSLYEFVDCNFHMDPAKHLGRNVNYWLKKYKLPRASVGTGRSAVSDSIPFRRTYRRSPPPLLHTRTFSSIPYLCMTIAKLHARPFATSPAFSVMNF